MAVVEAKASGVPQEKEKEQDPGFLSAFALPPPATISTVSTSALPPN